MFDPHAVLTYLFDDIMLEIPKHELQKYWQQAAQTGCPWALQELCESDLSDLRIPVKIFGDDCVYDERQTKAYAIYMSLPLWRPNSARNSRFLIWAQKSVQFAGFQGLQPLLARMVWSLNLLYDNRLEKSGYRFCVTEIGGDWSWNRFFWQFERHWNSEQPCPFCDVRKFGPQSYVHLTDIAWMPNIDFVNKIVGSGGSKRVNPFILLKNFDVSLIQPCQLHNLNLGLLWTSNGAGVATFGELGFWGDPCQLLALTLETAWDDFQLFLKQEGRHCSQSKFTIKMIFKASHGAYFSAKGYNSRVLADWLADCAGRAWERKFDGPRLFGKWLQGHPEKLQLALLDEQLPHLCLSLLLALEKSKASKSSRNFMNSKPNKCMAWVPCAGFSTLALILLASGFPFPAIWLLAIAAHASRAFSEQDGEKFPIKWGCTHGRAKESFRVTGNYQIIPNRGSGV